MEVSVNNTVVGNSSDDNSHYVISLLVTYLMCLVMIPIIVTPALPVIHVIRTVTHTSLWLINWSLMYCSNNRPGRYGLEFISMKLYLFDLPSE